VKKLKIAPKPPNPDWLELLLNLDWSSSASLQVDRWLDHEDREFGISEVV
jgi:hypothetical protein